MMKRALLAALAAVTLSVSPMALSPLTGPVRAAELSAQDRADLRRVEDYFNNLTTVRSTFLQASSTGNIAQGRVWMQRPGRLRFEYADPSPILITADGLWLTYQDNELEQTTQVPLSESAVGILVDEQVSFDDEDLEVESVSRESNVLRVTLTRDTTLEEGRLTLTFQDRPLTLKQWVVEDAQGVEVKVALLNPEFGVDLPARLFRPNTFERPGDQGR